MLTIRHVTRTGIRLAVTAAFLLVPATGLAQVAPDGRGRAAAATPTTTETILVSDVPLPDPFAYHDGDEWNIFGTGAEPYFLQGRAPVPGRMHKVALDLDYAGFTPRVAQVWRFTVYRHRDGSYHAYATLHLGHFRTVVWQKGVGLIEYAQGYGADRDGFRLRREGKGK